MSNLGKMWTVKLTSEDEAVYVFSHLEKECGFDTLCFENVMNVWVGKRDEDKIYQHEYWGERSFNVSLFVKQFSYSENGLFSNITFSMLKQKYNGSTYHIDDTYSCPLIDEIFSGVRRNKNIELDCKMNIKFKNDIHFCLQTPTDCSEGIERGGIYSIVGMRIWRWH